jgi:hypothetical protein
MNLPITSACKKPTLLFGKSFEFLTSFIFLCRDCSQLKPNITFALEACKNLLDTLSEVAKAQSNFSKSLSGLIEAQDCSIEKTIVREIQQGAEKMIPIYGEAILSLQTNLLEPIQFLEVDTMNIASSLVQDVNKLSPKIGKKYFEYHREMIVDWNTFRVIRHDILLSSIYRLTLNSIKQVSR